MKWLAMLILLMVVYAQSGYADDDVQANTPTQYTDLRSYQHGLNFLKLASGDYMAIFASNGVPPTAGWEHDIYAVLVSRRHPDLDATAGVKWISAPEAQEPVSAAINASGTKICVTWEDGNPRRVQHEVAQVVYVTPMPLSANPYRAATTIFDGGHSGHVAAVGEQCVVFWADGWTEGGGVDRLGSGNAVFVNRISAHGVMDKKIAVATGRAWWPMVAGSATTALLLWQKFVPDQAYADLYFGLFDATTNRLTKRATKLQRNLLYYHYSLTYLASIARFLVVASKDGGGLGPEGGRQSGGGSAWLIDNNGRITAKRDLVDGIIRESNIIVHGSTAVIARLKAGQPVFGAHSERGALGGLTVLHLSPSSIAVSETIADDYAWQYMGFDGFFSDATHVYTAALSKTGMRIKIYGINPAKR